MKQTTATQTLPKRNAELSWDLPAIDNLRFHIVILKTPIKSGRRFVAIRLVSRHTLIYVSAAWIGQHKAAFSAACAAAIRCDRLNGEASTGHARIDSNDT
jgi:hypothetical protein